MSSFLTAHQHIIAPLWLQSQVSNLHSVTSHVAAVCCETAYVHVCIASRLGRRPKRLKEMQLAVAAAVVGGGNMSTPSCSSSADQHPETSSAAVRRLCMSSSNVNSSLDVADVHAELQVLYSAVCCCTAPACTTSRLTGNVTQCILFIVIAAL